MKGWKTIVFSIATILLGVLQDAGVTNIIAQHPGTVTTVIGFLILVLRLITTTPVFQSTAAK